MRDRTLTWLICGPIGHFLGGFFDWLELLARYTWSRVSRRLPLLTLALFLALAPMAAAQGSFLAADASRAGQIDLVFFGPEGSRVEFFEGTRSLGSDTIDSAYDAAILRRATQWRCDRLVREFTAAATTANGRVLTGRFSLRTRSCRDRVEVLVARRVRTGSRVRVQLRDEWRLGLRTRLCLTAPRSRRAACRTVAVPAARAVTRSFRATRRGRWTVDVFAGGARTRSYVTAGRRGSGAVPLPTLLTTGDSTIQGIEAFLGDRVRGLRVASDFRPGSGLSSVPAASAVAFARGQVSRLRPRVTVISIGANDGHPMNGVECCSEAWTGEYARRVGAMMDVYAGGTAQVLWLTLPVPRDERRVPAALAINRAILAAARNVPGATVVRLDELFTPGGRYRETMAHGGRSVRVREADGVHLSVAGTEIAAGAVAAAIRPARR